MRKRLVQHNLRVVSSYFTKLTTSRLCELLGLNSDEMEEFVTEMVSEKTLYAKIDRPGGEIVFAKPQTPTETVAEWAASLDEVLRLVDSTTRLIQKENMVHKLLQ